jgi:hypothetical protein
VNAPLTREAVLDDLAPRVVADSADREFWTLVRSTGLGASDAAAFAKLESVELYVRAKLKERTKPFLGNAYTETGNRWEEPALASAGFKRNTLMFRSHDNEGFLATPDGLKLRDGQLVLAEAKTLLVRDFDPDVWEPKAPPTHRRQIAWAQYVLGAASTDYIVLPYDEQHRPLLMLPVVVQIPRDDELIARLITIATPVLAAMKAAADFERTLRS